VASIVGVLIVAARGATKQAANRHTPRRPTTIGVEDNSRLEKILVDSPGRTLYLFKRIGL
jgi:hypothetical protein